MKKRGFTIVELLMVIAVIAVLISITTSSVLGAMKRAREQRASVLCELVRQGFCTYYAQKGEWPWGDKTSVGEDDYYWLTESEVRDAVFKLVKESKNHNPMMDISGLYVSTQSGEPGMRHYGMDFMTAVRGSKQHPEKIPASRLHYGYPESDHGYFRRFIVKYSPVTDQVVVRTFTANEERSGRQKREEEK